MIQTSNNSHLNSAETIMMRTIEDALPELSLFSPDDEPDIRDGVPDDDYLLDWHYPGRLNVSFLLPDLDFTDVRANQGSAVQAFKQSSAVRGIFGSSKASI